MKKNKNISLSGLAGAGKSSVGKLLSNNLKYEFVSVGDYSRNFALKEFGMNINQFQEYCQKNPEIDKYIDEHFVNFCSNKSGLVIDYRLAFHLIEDCYNIYLDVSEYVAAQRIYSANDRDLEIGNTLNLTEQIRKRNENMKNRFIKLYNTDFTNPINYDLIINTDILSSYDVFKAISKKLNQ